MCVRLNASLDPLVRSLIMAKQRRSPRLKGDRRPKPTLTKHLYHDDELRDASGFIAKGELPEYLIDVDVGPRGRDYFSFSTED